jgi:biotin carboxyl carrier protein
VPSERRDRERRVPGAQAARAPGAEVARVSDDAARVADHAAIDRLTDELLPALMAKLGASGLGEIEIREGAWKVRLRRPNGATNGVPHGRRSTDRPSRPQPGHAGHGHAAAAVEGHRPAPGRDGPGSLTAMGPGRAGQDERRDPNRAVATSPAVGIFQPRPEMRPGTRVRAGDRLGFVDVLGVRQEVVSPVDGRVGATVVESGEAVEYGQELVRLELASAPAAAGEA